MVLLSSSNFTAECGKIPTHIKDTAYDHHHQTQRTARISCYPIKPTGTKLVIQSITRQNIVDIGHKVL